MNERKKIQKFFNLPFFSLSIALCRNDGFGVPYGEAFSEMLIHTDSGGHYLPSEAFDASVAWPGRDHIKTRLLD